MLRLLAPGEFVQGTIFTCGLSDSYPGVPALGLLITARCDTAQDKAEVYNYIPVVPVEAWLEKDGFEIVAKRLLANELGSMKKALSDADMAHSIMEFVEHGAILEELQRGTSKAEKGIAKRFQNAMQAAGEVTTLLSNPGRSQEATLAFLDKHDGIYRSVIRELMTNSIAEFHYLERCSINENTRGYVAVMREIRFISATLGKRIAVGIDAEEFRSSPDIFAPSLNHIRFSSESDFAMPLSCVESPFIELIMQRFAALFSRIGVTDLPKERIIEAHSWVKALRGIEA